MNPPIPPRPSSNPPFRFPVARPVFRGREREYVMDCLESGWVSSAGRYLMRFEESFARRHGGGYTVCVANGTVALDLALKALGIGPGDEVIVPNLTFAGSVSPIVRLHARPVLAPCSPGIWNLDANALEGLASPRTKAILVVHLYGVPCDMEAVMNFATERKLPVIEDCAEALCAEAGGKPVGTLGTVGCFSFYGNKVLTTGEGGMCWTRDSELAGRIRLYRDHGKLQREDYFHPVAGYNGRMTNMQAALGYGQFERLDEMLAARERVHASYARSFDATPYFQKPEVPPRTRPVTWLETRVLASNLKIERNEIVTALRAESIECRPFFYPVSDLPPYAAFGKATERDRYFSSRGFNLPTYESLSEEDAVFIASRVLHHIERLGK